MRGLPATTTRLVIGASMLGVALLTLFDFAAAVGALSGGALLWAARLCAGSTGRALLAGVLLPIGGVGAATAVWIVAGTPAGAGLAVLGATIGVTTVLLLTNTGPTERRLVRIGLLSAAAVCAPAIVLSAIVIDVGITVTGIGLGTDGLTTALLIVVSGLFAATIAIPPTMYTSAGSSARTGRRLLFGLLVFSPLLVGMLAVVFLPVVDSVVPVSVPTDAATGVPVELALFVLGVYGLALAYFGILVRASWSIFSKNTDLDRNPSVAVMIGSTIGVALLAVFYTMSTPQQELSGLLTVPTVLFALGYVALLQVRRLESVSLPGFTTVIALCLGGGAVVAVEMMSNDVTAMAGLRGVAVLASVALAVFVFTIGRFGQGLARDVGAGAGARIQLVAASWHGSIVVFGLVLAVGAVQFGALFAPAFSTPAALAVFAGVAVLLAVTVRFFHVENESGV